MFSRIIAGVVAAFVIPASACLAQQQRGADPAKVEAIVKQTFSKASPEWQARIALDETQRLCTINRNQVGAAEAASIQKREMERVAFPADGKFLGDWKKGFEVANNGRGGQFSDDDKTVNGGNCYACHQMDPKELSYGTLGPSLAGYGKDRKNDPAAVKATWTKIFDSQAVLACSNMPRFGAAKFLSEQQIKDVMAYLLDPDSPVNK